ncbi:MAG: family 78 glycoside hydrolase catalytic domain [Clostridia bacterium]|nr:family 78 glycoside hydrolase catalytic domain [Clostridia bacterium]
MKWICPQEFAGLTEINVYHKEHDDVTVEESAYFNKHMLYRKKFNLNKTGNYTVDITADDYYKLYVNGQFVGQGSAPCYHFAHYYNTYDISDFLTDGENVIAAHCYYQGLINRVWQSGDNRTGLCACVYEDKKELFSTDESWKYTYDERFSENAEPIGYDTQYTENIDMRKALHGWQNVDFDDSNWKNAVINNTDDHILKKSYIPPVSVYSMRWQSAKKISDNEYIIDFGKEIVGGLRLEIQGKEGNAVELMCAEELDENSLPRWEMRCNVEYREIWTLSGKADVIENFDYKAFRYVLAKTEEPAFAPENLTAVVRHYPADNKIEFRHKNANLKKVWDICENAVIMASQESFLDCPSREKGQYLGDLTVTAISHSYITGDTRLFRKALYDFADSAKICKGLMAVSSCSFMQEIADYSLLYPYQLMKYYQLSGDKQTLQELLGVAEDMLLFFKQYERGDGLIESVKSKWNLVDWPVNLRDNYDFELTKPIGEGCHAVINAYYYGALKMTDEIRGILNLEKIHNSKKVRLSFINAFMKGGLITDCENSSHSSLHSNALPLFFSMVDGEQAKPMIELIKAKKLCCGVYFSYFVLKGLCNYGRSDIAFDFITSEDENSWMNMVNEGATACFEAWGKEKKWNTSLCHPWASAPIIIIKEEIIDKL